MKILRNRPKKVFNSLLITYVDNFFSPKHSVYLVFGYYAQSGCLNNEGEQSFFQKKASIKNLFCGFGLIKRRCVKRCVGNLAVKKFVIARGGYHRRVVAAKRQGRNEKLRIPLITHSLKRSAKV